MAQFQRKRRVIDAEQYLPHLIPPQIPAGVTSYATADGYTASIILGEEKANVFPGDWIFTDEDGSLGVMREAYFADTFEPLP